MAKAMLNPASPSIVDDHKIRDITLHVPIRTRWDAEAIFAMVIILVGAAAGLGGMLLALLLHEIQHAAYGYDLGAIVAPESFLQGVTAASPTHRVIALTLCGAVAGIGWWALYRFGRSLVSVKAAIGKDEPGPWMPTLATIAHALLQTVTVALGSPLGREVAPREIGALLATWLASCVGLSSEDTRIAIACGAGAGLAAVYNVPLGGAVFILEVLLNTTAPRAAAAAIAASIIASTVAWTGLGDVAQYVVPPLEISRPLIASSIVIGPVFGLAAYGFKVVTNIATVRAVHSWKMVPWSIAVFLAIGLIATQFPQLPGNGKGPSQLGFDGDLNGSLAASLLVLKLLAVAASLRVGAAGGVLTPSLTIGALLATALCPVLTLVFPDISYAGFAIVGAAAFLASSMNMPLTAILLTLEFTRVSHDFCVPIFFAVAGSIAMLRACTSLASQPVQPHRTHSEESVSRRQT
jgi:H+/Cl- antiporter ClcA